MKGYQLFLKKIKNKILKFPHIGIFDLVIILIFLNCIAGVIVFLYQQRISSLALPDSEIPYVKITSVPDLPTDLNSINASAEAFIVYDTSSRSVIAGKNQNLRFSPASTAKIMTAVLTLSHYNLDDYLIVPPDIYTVQGSKMNLILGESVSVTNLLYGMLLPSGNDAAHTLAYYYPGGVNGFVKAMNDKANDLKLYNTHFADPAGYDDQNYTTAVDLARLASYAMQNPIFRKIVDTKYIQVSDRLNSHQFYLTNLNELLQYPDVIGVKTGFTNEAGGVLVTALMKNGKMIIVVVLKSGDRFSDTKDLMQFINEKVEYSNLPVLNSMSYRE
jgi:D-alanyl-D-alanine carboxypeptidase